MVDFNLKYTWCPKAVDKRGVRFAIVVGKYPRQSHAHFVLLSDNLIVQGYDVFHNYGSEMTYQELIADIEKKLNDNNRYVLFTHRSELLDSRYGRPDTMFIYSERTKGGEISIGLKSFDSLTQREIHEGNDIMRLYWGGEFEEHRA